MGYVCDGKVDCPKGIDETNCQNRNCSGLLHCMNTSQCVYIADTCHDVYDCFYGDDEHYCLFNMLLCPEECSCLGFTISCNLPQVNIPSQLETFKSMVFISISGNILFSQFTWFKSFLNVQFLILNKFSLPDFCVTVNLLQNILTIDIQSNSVITLRKQCFTNYKTLMLNISFNQINNIKESAFSPLNSLNILNLSYNKINDLNSKVLHGLQNLVF